MPTLLIFLLAWGTAPGLAVELGPAFQRAIPRPEPPPKLWERLGRSPRSDDDRRTWMFGELELSDPKWRPSLDGRTWLDCRGFADWSGLDAPLEGRALGRSGWGPAEAAPLLEERAWFEVISPTLVRRAPPWMESFGATGIGAGGWAWRWTPERRFALSEGRSLWTLVTADTGKEAVVLYMDTERRPGQLILRLAHEHLVLDLRGPPESGHRVTWRVEPLEVWTLAREPEALERVRELVDFGEAERARALTLRFGRVASSHPHVLAQSGVWQRLGRALSANGRNGTHALRLARAAGVLGLHARALVAYHEVLREPQLRERHPSERCDLLAEAADRAVRARDFRLADCWLAELESLRTWDRNDPARRLRGLVQEFQAGTMDPEAQQAFALGYWRQSGGPVRRPEEAEPEFEALVAASSDGAELRPEVFEALRECALQREDLAAACAWTKRLLARVEGDADRSSRAVAWMAYAYRSRHLRAQAIALYRFALERFPGAHDRSDLQYVLAVELLRERREEEALALLGELLADAERLLTRGRLQHRPGHETLHSVADLTVRLLEHRGDLRGAAYWAEFAACRLPQWSRCTPEDPEHRARDLATADRLRQASGGGW